ncbi:SDR family NAD(P)-dependent oxidoreductase [Limobrevibacterium gyesilva]|uniref:SDR family oxidoreductase n=1 Tax=Limobrevibacterium gyesilva TaxID=2991712 RepID=A0AA42CH83_9PROT|nr:SDR family oxidoreductase [Limobrevibacterium gyesilva]MCW3474575.1 SDR family oxidoreductase [Limobrevibacterium gyesilva]
MNYEGEFKGKRVVVTGAAGIYGGWIAAAFAREGAVLCLSDLRRDKLDDVAARLGLDPATTLLHGTDLTDASSIRDLALTVAGEWEAPDIVINNAGVYPRTGILLNLDEAEFDRIMDVNVRAPFIVTKEMARLMIARNVQGAFVNIGSGAARQMPTGSVTYCMSKTALERLSKGQALELAPHRIRVNVVEPGFAPGSDFSLLPEDYVERMIARIPMGRTSGPGDTPAMVLYLCSKAAAFVTGTMISVDGGNSIGTYQPAPAKS